MQNNECVYICEQFTEYQENTLTSEIKAKVDAHLASCASCQEVFQQLNQVINTLHKLPSLSTSKDFTSSLMSRIEDLSQVTPLQKFYRSSYTRVAGYAIAAGLVVAIGINVLVDPISPNNPGVKSNYAGEQEGQTQPVESLAEVQDSSQSSLSDSLSQQNTTIQTNTQSMQLVSGKK